MNKNTIEYLAYLLDKAKQEGIDKAIVFLGAGASVSAGIPLTHVIVRHIKLKFRKNYLIREYKLNGVTDYYELMGALTADERRDLFHFYVTRDKVKLNMANVYLAQLLKEGYVDYIVTVNFDDLILKACTLFNFLPPVYDVSNIKTITTTDIRTGSVIYLHGQYFGQWLLNNEEELEKVEQEVLSFFNTIKTRRTWIVVGYSGNDGIFEKIKSLGSFSNEFFWVKKKLNKEYDRHVLDFLETPNNNVRSIEGFYADTFFLKLHTELTKLDNSLNPPDIFYKPFTHVKSIMQNVNEINGKDELNEQVKNIIEICNDRVNKAIEQFENEETIEDFKQRIIDAILKSEFNEEEALKFEQTIEEETYTEANLILSWYYIEWGNMLLDIARQKKDKNLYKLIFEKYKVSIQLNPDAYLAYTNWGIALSDLGELLEDESLYELSIEKYKLAIKLNSKNVTAHINWGAVLMDLAKLTQDESLFKLSLEKYEIAEKLNSGSEELYNSWGVTLAKLGRITSNDQWYFSSFDKFKKAQELNKKYDLTYYNWSKALTSYTYSKIELTQDKKVEILQEAKEKALIGYKLGSPAYNLSCAYALIKDKDNALKYLKESLEKNQISKEHILEDEDWKHYLEDDDFKTLIANY